MRGNGPKWFNFESGRPETREGDQKNRNTDSILNVRLGGKTRFFSRNCGSASKNLTVFYGCNSIMPKVYGFVLMCWRGSPISFSHFSNSLNKGAKREEREFQ